MIPRAIQIGLMLVVAGCTRSDPGMINLAASLVPEGSQITEVAENTGFAGPYSGTIHIDDGGLGPALLEAIEDQAVSDGWQERYRCDVLNGVTLGYSRDDFKVDVSVLTKREPVYAVISIMRIGEGNPWPPDFDVFIPDATCVVHGP